MRNQNFKTLLIYSAPKQKPKLNSLDEVDPELLDTFKRLGISAGKSQNSYRGLVQINSRAENARNFSQCDSLLMGNECGPHFLII